MSNWPEWTSPDGRIRLINADCLEVLPHIECDAVITDPPYGMEWKNDQRFSGGNTRRGKGTRHEQIAGDDRPFDPRPFLQLNVPTVIWGANHFWNMLPPGASLVWKKRNDDALGTFLSDAEIAYLSVGCGVYVFAKTFAGSMRAIDGQVGAYDGSLHPNQKPVALMKWCLERAKVPAGGVVFDPYAGSGTTAVACIRSERRCVAVEIEPVHFQAAVARCQREYARTALFNDQEACA
jgi:site-specific DNA-methyltransferase (adenine-specific)